MQRTTQRGRDVGTRPLWLRIAAFVCVLLIAVAGVAQAAHIHGDWLPNSAAQVAAHSPSSSGVGEDACPLCVAMHSALPVTGFGALIVGLLLEINLLLASSRKPRTLWYFAGFSRPPPSVLL
ncbi:MAG TPA: hypothetical protein VGU25_15070 [Acidobacteriaceae bacterium]|nr:hypothetical protein [Acidobacteriaceae bacterium]